MQELHLIEEERKTTYHLGITLAGAVSAGAYTAGVMDYLFETLERWERAKQHNLEALSKAQNNLQKAIEIHGYDLRVPMHRVVIDAMGGASAGSMAATLSLLQLALRSSTLDGKKAHDQRLMHDCWVAMKGVEHPSGSKGRGDAMLMSLLANHDLRDDTPVKSLLNTAPVDKVGDYALGIMKTCKLGPLPSYVSPHMDLLLTLTSLRGVPFEIHFSRKNPVDDDLRPAHVMKYHKGVAHFTLDEKTAAAHKIPLRLSEADERRALVQVATASGAFPLGLAFRKIGNIRGHYLKAFLRHALQLQQGDGRYKVEIQVRDQAFEFAAVDGGVLNNEPFEQVNEVLQEVVRAERKDGHRHEKALMMVDPFPNFQGMAKYRHPSNVWQSTRLLVGTLLNQGRFKDPLLIKKFASEATLGMVFPSRRRASEARDYTLATGALEGFAGFFKREFRQHDYELGRKNCQSFLKSFFYIAPSQAPAASIFRSNLWDDQGERWQLLSKEVEGERRIPLIPDLSLREEGSMCGVAGAPPDLPYPSFDRRKISLEEVATYRKPLELRIRSLVSVLLPPYPPRKASEDDAPTHPDDTNRPANDLPGGGIKWSWTTLVVLVVTLPLMAILLRGTTRLLGLNFMQLLGVVIGLGCSMLVLAYAGYRLLVPWLVRRLLNVVLKEFQDNLQLQMTDSAGKDKS